MAHYRIHLFGEFSAADAEGDPVKVGNRKAELLLAYLLLRSAHPQPRERLVDLFWPEASEARGKQSLRQAVYALRSKLKVGRGKGREWIQTTQETVSIHPEAPVWVDVKAFEAALAPQHATTAELESAVSLYRGDLLGSCYDDWCLEDREYLRGKLLGALNALADLHERGRNPDRAIEVARRSLGVDPFQEAVHRQLMRLYVTTGDRAAALRQYEGMAGRFAEELDVEPLPETRALYEQIQSQTPHAAIEAALEAASKAGRFELGAPFVNRLKELGAFVGAWKAAGQGGGQAHVLAGEAGVGKSRLLSEAIQHARGDGGLVFVGRCHAFEEQVPYQPLVDALREGMARCPQAAFGEVPAFALWEATQLVPELKARFPGLPEAGEHTQPEQQNARRLDALTQLWLALGRHRPVLLVVDDVQWADPATLQSLHHVVRRLADAPVVVLMAYREGEVDEAHPLKAMVSDLARDQRLHRHELAPLERQDSDALVAGLLRDEGGGDALGRQVFERARGVPFYAEELVKSVVESGALALDEDGRWRLDEARLDALALPDSIRALIDTRLRRLSRTARQLLELAAVAGRRFSHDWLAHAMGPWQQDGFKPLEELLWARFLDEQEDGYAFHHDLVRQHLYQRLSPERRRHFHLRLAEALEDLHAGEALGVSVLGDLASHYVEAKRWPKALEYALQAGERAWSESYAKESALHYFRQALDLAKRLKDAHGTMLAYKGLGAVCAATDLQDEGLKHCERALAACTDPALRADIHLSIASVFHHRRDLEQGLAHCEKALRELGKKPVPRVKAKAMFRAMTFLNWLNRFDEAMAYGNKALKSLEKESDTGLLALVLTEMGQAKLAKGSLESAMVFLERAVDLAEFGGDPLGLAVAHFKLGMMHYNSGQLHSSVEVWERALALLNQIDGQQSNTASIYNFLTYVRIRQQRLDEALDYAKRQLALYKDAKNLKEIGASYALLGCLLSTMGNEDEAKNCFSKGLSLNPQNPLFYQYAIYSCLMLDLFDQAIEWLKKGTPFLEVQHINLLNTCPTFTEAFTKLRKHPAFERLIRSQQTAS